MKCLLISKKFNSDLNQQKINVVRLGRLINFLNFNCKGYLCAVVMYSNFKV
jgi:hypothetical protein